mmetsp:Transcript_18253/g.41490  ORF Transcript_18253/g.41490 Transcript_18253/m.41490 type:complete len:200 (+) Transcript_18253:1224-1823(+)
MLFSSPSPSSSSSSSLLTSILSSSSTFLSSPTIVFVLLHEDVAEVIARDSLNLLVHFHQVTVLVFTDDEKFTSIRSSADDPAIRRSLHAYLSHGAAVRSLNLLLSLCSRLPGAVSFLERRMHLEQEILKLLAERKGFWSSSLLQAVFQRKVHVVEVEISVRLLGMDLRTTLERRQRRVKGADRSLNKESKLEEQGTTLS